MKLKYAAMMIILWGFIFLPVDKALPAEAEKIQMAILLDTSSSMDGLIEQAKSQLWKIVNELALARKNGKTPRIEIALYEYGKSSLASEKGYIRQILSLTNDLDKVSEELFKLTTNGGDEYCGMVIQRATNELPWHKKNDILKVIFIAGNEPFSQGEVDYKKACKYAIGQGIIVNTIFCGNKDEGIRSHWKDGADLADGTYINIDHNYKVQQIKAPQDEKIVELGKQLNETYLAYGSRGYSYKKRQEAQDYNAASMSKESLVSRSVAKASSQYNNAGWDLVDAVKNKKVDIASLKTEELPEEMKKMTTKERAAYIQRKLEKRASLQKEIRTLQNARRAYITKEKKKNSEKNSLDEAIIRAVRQQAKNKKYSFQE